MLLCIFRRIHVHACKYCVLHVHACCTHEPCTFTCNQSLSAKHRVFISVSRVNTGLAPGRKRAYMLYKAALTDASNHQNTQEDGESPLVSIAPHPYFLALGVLSIQKVSLQRAYSIQISVCTTYWSTMMVIEYHNNYY